MNKPGTAPDSVRVVACGMTESGKDYWLKRLYLERCPRALMLDPLGEYIADKRVGFRVYEAESLADVRRALARAAKEGPRWRVVARIDAQHSAAVARLLVPPVIRAGGAFPQHVGGMGLYCSELDLFAPTAADPDVVGLWRRGRHVGLSIYGASQRPHGISRMVTAMSGWLVVCQTHEPKDVAYLGECLPSDAMEEVNRLEWQAVFIWRRQTSSWVILDRAGKVLKSGAVSTSALHVSESVNLTPSSESVTG
jgi:hypothetical protein